MSIHELVFNGCNAEFFIQYLKAHGIFRILATQKEKTIKGFWGNGLFVVKTALEKDEIVDFFINEYEPSPLIAPWNGGSGFYGKAAEGYLKAIEDSTVPRLEKYRLTIKECRDLLEELGISSKPDDTKLKEDLRLRIRQTLNDDALSVMDALFMLQTNPSKSGEIETRYSSLLGSGGNDGNLEFTNTFMFYLGKVIDFGFEPDKNTAKELSLSKARLKAAIFGENQAPAFVGSVGQFFPGGAGGVNLSVGYSGESLVNPWDYILALEGVLVFKGAVVRQLDVDTGAKAAFPFSVAGTAAGWGSISKNDEGANSRAEIWLPIWDKPATLQSISYLFTEGRVKVGKKKAYNGLDFARAIAGLGVDRGITSFQRLALVSGDRFGKMFFAVNMGSYPVRYRKNIRLLDKIDDWLYKWRTFAGQKGTPARYRDILANMEDDIFRYTQYGRAEDLTAILITLGAAEESLRYLIDKETPCQPLLLEPNWVSVADDGTVEYRLATALASLERACTSQGSAAVGTMREFFEPVEISQKGGYVWSNQIKLQGSSFEERLLYVLERRLIASERNNLPNWPLKGKYQAGLGDLEMFLNGAVNMEKMEKLFKGLLLIKWDEYVPEKEKTSKCEIIDPVYAALKLVFWPENLEIGDKQFKIGREYSLVSYLRSGDLQRAYEKSLRRLRASNLEPKLDPRDPIVYPRDNQRSIRLGAALLIPLSNKDLPKLIDCVLKTSKLEV
mgnify:CR=1 FL=1